MLKQSISNFHSTSLVLCSITVISISREKFCFHSQFFHVHLKKKEKRSWKLRKVYQQEAEKIPDIIYPHAYLRNITKIQNKNTNTHTKYYYNYNNNITQKKVQTFIYLKFTLLSSLTFCLRDV